jgi:hypothetical protein
MAGRQKTQKQEKSEDEEHGMLFASICALKYLRARTDNLQAPFFRFPGTSLHCSAHCAY